MSSSCVRGVGSFAIASARVRSAAAAAPFDESRPPACRCADRLQLPCGLASERDGLRVFERLPPRPVGAQPPTPCAPRCLRGRSAAPKSARRRTPTRRRRATPESGRIEHFVELGFRCVDLREASSRAAKVREDGAPGPMPGTLAGASGRSPRPGSPKCSSRIRSKRIDATKATSARGTAHFAVAGRYDARRRAVREDDQPVLEVVARRLFRAQSATGPGRTRRPWPPRSAGRGARAGPTPPRGRCRAGAPSRRRAARAAGSRAARRAGGKALDASRGLPARARAAGDRGRARRR